ncbi:isocitrate lyase/PEP mutase family protein [Bradyrhizobium sp. WYCCWR 13022]|uniref:isocitrate lyase/PEP mutase family protein n=1 Tax=unclassified Bradyrhizobium TaxID=2631580 RepID=UPI00263B2D01|nr:isocitrate lyase/PEP mutase family protein [Bradyrhizobium sp. WYCCWR 13022]MDN4984322.1 isocitrate lyase/PEP mutase family protein [Bradyrhizobium sp. WYCCWR 13022]
MERPVRSRSASDRRRAFKARLTQPGTIAVPGAYDALSAKLIEREGFEAVYLGSYATSAARFAAPDVGLVTLEDMISHASTIVRAVNVPVVCDAEAGWFNAANIWKTVESFESIGVCGIHMEDHEFGKHAPVAPRMTPLVEAAARIRAAVEARTDPNFLIIARTDALWISGSLTEVVDRLNAYAGAGADLLMPTRVSPEQVQHIRERVSVPIVITDRPGVSLAAEREAGAKMVLYYGLTLYAAFSGVRNALNDFAEKQNADVVPNLRAVIPDLESMLDYGAFAERARRYGLT